MDIITIDFETYYDREYSLSKMTTEAYVRDSRFEVIGVGIKINGDPADWYSGSEPGRFLNSLKYNDKAILCHNTAFDGAILSWHFGVKPKLWIDTLSMARPFHQMTAGGSLKALAEHYGLGVKGTEVLNALGKRRADFSPAELSQYGAYCTNDVELTYKLFRKLGVGFPATEIAIIDQVIRMYTEPTIEIDAAVLNEHLDDVQNKKAKLIADLGFSGNEEDTKKFLMSNEKFAALLEHFGVEPPTKTSARTGKAAWAFSKTDKDFLSLLEHSDARVSTLVAARLGTKSTIEESRTKSLLGVAERGRLPIMLNYFGAHTGRFSGGDKMNLQNLPRGGALRKSLRAPDGMKLVACDSAQIEARMVAWVAEQEDLIEAFREGRDVYSEFATEVYGKPVTRDDKVERFVGKTCILGLGYGMGAEKFQRTLSLGQGGISVKISLEEAQRIVRLYREKNHKIVSLWYKCGDALRAMANGDSGEITPLLQFEGNAIYLPNKLAIRYPALCATSNGFEYINDSRSYRKYRESDSPEGIEWTKIYGGKVVENLVQALARIVVCEQMLRVGRFYKVVLQVHDEVVAVAPESEADEAVKFIEATMSMPPIWAPDLPVSCECHAGDNYGEVK